MHGAIGMTKAGRKRKSGRRYASGDIVRELLENKSGPTQIKRMFDHLLRSARDPALGTPMGRMFLEGFITPAEYNAGIKFALLRAKADRAMGVPARNPRALDYNHGLGGRSLVIDDPEYEQALVAALDDVEIAIGGALSAVYRVVVSDEMPAGYDEKLRCKEGLAKAAAHWRLD